MAATIRCLQLPFVFFIMDFINHRLIRSRHQKTDSQAPELLGCNFIKYVRLSENHLTMSLFSATFDKLVHVTNVLIVGLSTMPIVQFGSKLP